MISSQRPWPLDHEAGQIATVRKLSFYVGAYTNNWRKAVMDALLFVRSVTEEFRNAYGGAEFQNIFIMIS